MERLAVIDADHILYIATHNKKLKNAEGESIEDESGTALTQEKTLEEVLHDADLYLKRVLMGVNADYYIGALTTGKCFRYSIYPEYKANRKYGEKPAHFKELKQYLVDKWGFISHPDLEADDIVSIISKTYYENTEVIVVSPDKDVLYLEGLSYDPSKQKFYMINKEMAEERLAISLIVGDSTDNIKGIKGAGPVAAKKVLEAAGIGFDPFGLVLGAYIDNYGQKEGVEEFYKNYKCLKIVEIWPEFKVPVAIKVDFNVEEERDNREVGNKDDEVHILPSPNVGVS